MTIEVQHLKTFFIYKFHIIETFNVKIVIPSDYFNKNYKDEIIVYYNKINVLTLKELLK